MPYVLKNIRSGTYGHNITDVNKARQFSSTRAAYSSRDYNPGQHVLVEVQVVERTGIPIRQGTWLTWDEYHAKYGSQVWAPGENLTKSPHWEHLVEPFPGNPDDLMFQEKNKKVYQVVFYRQVTTQAYSTQRVQEPIMCEVYPNKPLHWHTYERRGM